MNYLKIFILCLASTGHSVMVSAQTEADKQALENQVAELMLQKSAAEATFREQTILQSKIDSFLVFHRASVDDISRNIKDISDLQSQIDSAIEVDKKALNEITLWLDSTLSHTRVHNNSVQERNQIELQRQQYENSCRKLVSKELISNTSNLLAKTTALIGLYRSRMSAITESPGVPPEFQNEIKIRLNDMTQFELSVNQMKAALKANDKEPDVCTFIRDLTRIIDIMEIYNSVSVFLNSEGLTAINKDISSFLLSIDKEIQDSEKATFTKRYLIALQATFEDYHRRGLIEKMNQLSTRLSDISLFLISQIKFISNQKERSDIESEISKVIADINTKHITSTSDIEDLNAILYRRLKYLLAKAIQTNTKKPLSLTASKNLNSVGIDTATKKLNYTNKNDFGEVMKFCNDLATAEELLAKE